MAARYLYVKGSNTAFQWLPLYEAETHGLYYGHGVLLAAKFSAVVPFRAMVPSNVISHAAGGVPVNVPSIHAEEQPEGLQVEKLADVTVN